MAVKLHDGNTYLVDGRALVLGDDLPAVNNILQQSGKVERSDLADLHRQTLAYAILHDHNTSGDETRLKIKFDALASHDITYVGIIQTARSSGMTEFPLPFALTNCHNSLCAVGGTINEDDHAFGLSAARRYGGIYVPAHLAVIHQYVRETMTGCGRMILGSDSHTRYGALGTMAMGEGGPELVKQLLKRTYDIEMPPVVCVFLENAPQKGVGPHDVALAIIAAVFEKGFVKNSVLEFVGPGVSSLSMDFRNGIDVMTTETTCLSSIWTTDDKTKEYFATHGRPEDFRALAPGEVARYDKLVQVNLAAVEPMIALPYHPSNAFPIGQLIESAGDFFAEIEAYARKRTGRPISLRDKITPDGIFVDQGIIAGCSGGTFENVSEAADIIGTRPLGSGDFALSIYPQSQPVFWALSESGAIGRLMTSGAVIRTAFCGPCFGAGDVPRNNGLSIRHTTRNFPNREGAKPGDGQTAGVALMDARSIAATAANGGRLTPATALDYETAPRRYRFNREIYGSRVYNGFPSPQPKVALRYGPNIKDWPEMDGLYAHLLLQAAAVIDDPVTTTDELIPSGETSSYRSNPMKLAEFTLSRKDPEYVGRAQQIKALDDDRKAGRLKSLAGLDLTDTGLGSFIYANRPGDGSAREQAASCQKVLGGWANVALDYATKRYRSNVINWGMLPFVVADKPDLKPMDYLFIPNIRRALLEGWEEVPAQIIDAAGQTDIVLMLPGMTRDERDIVLAGCLMNYYKKNA